MHLPKFEECKCPPLDLLKISLCHQPLVDDLQNPQSSQEYENSVGHNKNLFNVFDNRKTLRRLCRGLNITEILTLDLGKYSEAAACVRATLQYGQGSTLKKSKLVFLWSQAFKCRVKMYRTRLLTKCYFITIRFM